MNGLVNSKIAVSRPAARHFLGLANTKRVLRLFSLSLDARQDRASSNLGRPGTAWVPLIPLARGAYLTRQRGRWIKCVGRFVKMVQFAAKFKQRMCPRQYGYFLNTVDHSRIVSRSFDSSPVALRE
ncbi:MAG: hypothetical protein ACREO8_07730 [Luteimonas sp.]